MAEFEHGKSRFWWRRFDEHQVSSIMQRLFPRARAVAKQSLRSTPLRYADEEDVLLSACWHFCLGVLNGAIPSDLDPARQQRLLNRMVRQKAIDYVRRFHADKRGGGKVRGDSAFERPNDPNAGGIDQVPDKTVDGLTAAMMEQNKEILLAELGSDDLRQIVLWKVDGYS